MQQGRTGCKRHFNAPLPAPGARSLRHVPGGERLFLPPSRSTEKHAWMAWQSPQTHGLPPHRGDRWICATTTQSAGCYLLDPGALCRRGLQASPLGAVCHSLHIPKAVALPRVTSRDTRLLVKLRQGRALTPTHTHSHAPSLLLAAPGPCTRTARAWQPRLRRAEPKAHRVPGDSPTHLWRAPPALGTARKHKVEKGQQ